MENSVLIPPIMLMTYSSVSCLLLILLYLSSTLCTEKLDFRKITHHTASMGRSPCCEKIGLKKGPWTPEEDQKLLAYIEEHGHGSWRALPAKAGEWQPSWIPTILQMNKVCETSTNILQACRGAGRAADWGGQTTWGRTSRGASSACKKSRPSSSFMLFLVTGEYQWN